MNNQSYRTCLSMWLNLSSLYKVADWFTKCQIFLFDHSACLGIAISTSQFWLQTCYCWDNRSDFLVLANHKYCLFPDVFNSFSEILREKRGQSTFYTGNQEANGVARNGGNTNVIMLACCYQFIIFFVPFSVNFGISIWSFSCNDLAFLHVFRLILTYFHSYVCLKVLDQMKNNHPLYPSKLRFWYQKKIKIFLNTRVKF